MPRVPSSPSPRTPRVPCALSRSVAAPCLALSIGVTTAYGTLSFAQSSHDMAPATVTVSGVATYRERIALPPGASFEATLEDTSRADAAAIVLGQVVIDEPRTPIRFEIPYDPSAIAPGRAYAVRARIVVDGQLWFTTDHIYRVLTRDSGDSVEIVLKSVRGAATEAAPFPKPV